MKNTILFLLVLFICFSCGKKCSNEQILITINYAGNQDRYEEYFLLNYSLSEKLALNQSEYRVQNNCMLQNIKSYAQLHNSKFVHKLNKLKVVIIEKNVKKQYFFNATDGIRFIDFLEKEVYISPDNKYFNDQYFKKEVLPVLRSELKFYSGKEYMYD
ncbi:hypothetical protein [Chryseobacterium sp. Marseille-Q3244]|uniref:hypothetical protein n=1 Tax=Chryseobacterium sp. Marseille-Q3244 TaxID=2758092 RepID=UPI0020250CD5|nr:hypothetical protein [Chryseobacterium sp. Marseille-Q3244]